MTIEELIKKMDKGKIIPMLCISQKTRPFPDKTHKNCQWLNCDICKEKISVSEYKRNIKKCQIKKEVVFICDFCLAATVAKLDPNVTTIDLINIAHDSSNPN